MDNEKDFYIKEFLEKDQLISKKANDVFDNFFKEELNMKEEQENKKVVEFEKFNSKVKNNKKIHKRKFLTAVASCAVVFIGANVYATTKGYDNIFFMIRDLTKTKEVTEMSEILEDRDILISYKSIEIAKGIKIQINELVLKDGEGKLFVRVETDSGKNTNIPVIFKVYDDDNNVLLGTKDSTEVEFEYATSYVEEILLKNIKNNTNKLKLELINKENEEIAVLKVDLLNKEVLIGEGIETDVKKLSEVELKQILGDYVLLNKYKDENYAKNNNTVLTETQWKNGQMVEIAINFICDKNSNEVNGKFEVEEVNKVIKEFTGKEITGPLDIGECFGVIEYNKNSKKYEFLPGEGFVSAKCLEIEKLSFADDVYTVTFSYCYPSENDYFEGNIEELDIYKTTTKFKLNENYKYTKYCLVDFDENESEKVQDNNNSQNNSNDKKVTNTISQNNNSTTKPSSNTSNTESSSSTNTSNNNTSTNNQKVDNYASTMKWKNGKALGLKFEYPEIFELFEKNYEVDGSQITTVITGVATGINNQTKEILNSNMKIEIYKPEITEIDNEHEYYEKVFNKKSNLKFCGFCTADDLYWAEYDNHNGDIDEEIYANYYTNANGVHIGRKIVITYDAHKENRVNFKVTNITNRFLGSTQLDNSQYNNLEKNVENNSKLDEIKYEITTKKNEYDDEKIAIIKAIKDGKTVTKEFEMGALIANTGTMVLPTIGSVAFVADTGGEYYGVNIYQLVNGEIKEIGAIDCGMGMVEEATYSVETKGETTAVITAIRNGTVTKKEFEMSATIAKTEVIDVLNFGKVVLVAETGGEYYAFKIFRLSQDYTNGKTIGIVEAGTIQYFR